jgi:glyoxylase-like metal-dependent hydrolase (beta-lactamase superfamily II)
VAASSTAVRLDPGVTYLHPAVPRTPEPVQVAPGIHWLRLPLPFALDHVNLWLLEDDGGWLLIDTGIASDETRAMWMRILAEGLGGRPITRILATHFHPDHLGLAGWLCALTGAPLLVSRTEWLTGRMLAQDDGVEMVRTGEAFYRRAGLADEAIAVQRRRGNTYSPVAVPPPATFERLEAGGTLRAGGRTWRLLAGEGHSPEQIALLCETTGVLIGADLVLPRISPNVSVWPAEPGANPLRAYLRSLGELADLPDDLLVLPSHDQPFHGLLARIEGLRGHHAARLERALALCRTPRTAAEVMADMFRRTLDPHQTMFAVGETLAHLNHLIGEGRLARERGDDGRDRYLAV